MAPDPDPVQAPDPAFDPSDPSQRWRSRPDAIVAAALAVSTFLLRWPIRSQHLNGWDAASFALALEDYDVLAQRPHAPGYPVYIAAAKALRVAVPEANACLVLLSILFSAGAVVATYALAREFVSLRTAVVGAILLVMTPFFVFNGVIALSYTAECFASAILGWIAWRQRARPSVRTALLLGGAWALAIGLRPSLAMFLAPLVAYALWPRPGEWRPTLRRGAYAAAAGAIVTLAWALPMFMATSHGFDGWRRAMRIQSEWVVFAESVLTTGYAGLLDRTRRLAFFLDAEGRYLAPVVLAVFLLGAALRGSLRAAAPGGPRARDLLIAWLLPVTLFYLLVFDGWDKGPTGYVLVLFPGLYVVVAIVLEQTLQALSARRPQTKLGRLAPWFVLGLALTPAIGYQADAHEWLEREVVAHDRWAQDWAQIREAYPPNETAILSYYSWSHTKWYYPDYLQWGYFPIPRSQDPPDWELFLETRDHRDDVLYYEAHERGPRQSEHAVPSWVKTIVLFDFQLAGENGERRRLADDVIVVEDTLASGMRILLMQPDAGRPTIESYFRPLPP